jgi:hypothetical protein
MTERVYISGKIGDDPIGRKPFFDHAEGYLRRQGFLPVNPMWISASGLTYAEYMKIDIRMLLDCDAIYMLQGWESSPGATEEKRVAQLCGLRVMYEMVREDA